MIMKSCWNNRSNVMYMETFFNRKSGFFKRFKIINVAAFIKGTLYTAMFTVQILREILKPFKYYSV